MKELEKTKRISIAAVLTILVVIIGLLTYKRPKHIYTTNTQDTLEKVTNYDYFIALHEVDNSKSVLIDIRNAFDYNKGHLDNAINIASPEILTEENSIILKNIKEENKTIILYGNDPTETISSHLLLSQLGYENIKILTSKISYEQNKLITQNVAIEEDAPDINAFIQESVKKKAELMKKAIVVPKPKTVSAPKKVVPVKKKKKMPVEGGC